MVQQSEHLSPISNHYTHKQWRFNKVNIFLLSQIIIHKNSDGSTKWTSYSISNHYTQKQWRFNKVNIFLLSQIIIHKNSDGSTKWTSFSYLKSLDTRTVTVQQSEHPSPISNHYTQKQWRFNKVNIFLLSQIIIHKNSDGSTKWTSFSYLKSLYTRTVTVQQSEHLSPISNHYTQKQWRFNKMNIFLLSQIIIHKNSDGSTKWTSFSYLKSLYTRTVTVQQSEHLSPISNHYTQKQW
jgi:diacylglycerol kinase family enzyme